MGQTRIEYCRCSLFISLPPLHLVISVCFLSVSVKEIKRTGGASRYWGWFVNGGDEVLKIWRWKKFYNFAPQSGVKTANSLTILKQNVSHRSRRMPSSKHNLTNIWLGYITIGQAFWDAWQVIISKPKLGSCTGVRSCSLWRTCCMHVRQSGVKKRMTLYPHTQKKKQNNDAYNYE